MAKDPAVTDAIFDSDRRPYWENTGRAEETERDSQDPDDDQPGQDTGGQRS